MSHLIELVSLTPKMKQKLSLMMPAHATWVCMEGGASCCPLFWLWPLSFLWVSFLAFSLLCFVMGDQVNNFAYRASQSQQEKTGHWCLETRCHHLDSYNTRISQHNFSLCKGCLNVTLSEGACVCPWHRQPWNWVSWQEVPVPQTCLTCHPKHTLRHWRWWHQALDRHGLNARNNITQWCYYCVHIPGTQACNGSCVWSCMT